VRPGPLRQASRLMPARRSPSGWSAAAPGQISTTWPLVTARPADRGGGQNVWLSLHPSDSQVPGDVRQHVPSQQGTQPDGRGYQQQDLHLAGLLCPITGVIGVHLIGNAVQRKLITVQLSRSAFKESAWRSGNSPIPTPEQRQHLPQRRPTGGRARCGSTRPSTTPTAAHGSPASG
jgi:hypothetical protein